jgi:hypothetical protein
MNINSAKELLPIIQAYAEGKIIQINLPFSGWEDSNEPSFNGDPSIYRIKPEPKYRPFKDAEECWQEMLKHQPFGVVKDKYFANYQTHRAFTCLTTKGCYFRGYEDVTFDSSFKNLLFADGLPFGVKIEE